MTAKYAPPPLASEPLYRNAVLFDTPKSLPAPAPQPSLLDAWKRHVQARFPSRRASFCRRTATAYGSTELTRSFRHRYVHGRRDIPVIVRMRVECAR
jgi:hypothetical protein